MKREADFTIYFRHWLRAYHSFLPSCALEIKQTTKDYISFDEVKEHQIDALVAVNSYRGLLYKIPDDSRGIKPFDMVYFRQAPAYVVIRYPKEFHIISIENFRVEKERSIRKSLTCDRAREISVVSVIIKK